MDAITVLLNFSSDKKEEIMKDFYNSELKYVDFEILLPCPPELYSTISGTTQGYTSRLLKEYNLKFDDKADDFADKVKEKLKQIDQLDYYSYAGNLLKESEEGFEEVLKTIRMYNKYGFGTWLDFRYSQWGVAQNAFPYGRKRRSADGGFYFVTASGLPTGWLCKLSEKWKDVVFTTYSRSEAINNQGMLNVYEFVNGKRSPRRQIKRHI